MPIVSHRPTSAWSTWPAPGRATRCWIHTATGGASGSAAIQLARHLGADVFATARPDKQATLRAWGVPRRPADRLLPHLLDFADAFRAVTGGRAAWTSS